MPGVDAKDPVWDRYRAILDARSSFRNFEFSYCGPDGQRFHASISGHPLYSPDGQFVGYRGTARDITAEVEAKEQAERTTALLDAVRQIQSSYIGDSDPKGGPADAGDAPPRHPERPWFRRRDSP